MSLLPSRDHSSSAGIQFTVPQRVGAESTWVAGYTGLYRNKVPSPGVEPEHMVTHPSTNRAWRRLTSLIKTNALQLRQTATND